MEKIKGIEEKEHLNVNEKYGIDLKRLQRIDLIN